MNGNIDNFDINSLDIDRMFGDKYRTNTIPYIEFAKTGFKQSKEHYRSYIDKYNFSNFEKVIDLGGGYGRWAVFLAERNGFIYVLDQHPYLVDMGPRLVEYLGFNNIIFIRGSVEEVPFVSSYFDAAWLHGLLFLVNREKTLAEIYRILKPGGRVFMGAVNSVGKMIMKMCSGYIRGGINDEHCVIGRTALRQGPFVSGPPNYATKETLDKIFNRFGLEIEYKYPVEDHMNKSLNNLEPEIKHELNYLPGFVLRFEEDNSFREKILKNYKIIVKNVEFDLWFSARKNA